MAVKKRKPTSPGRRFQTVSDFAEITATEPEKSLIDKKGSTGGRNTNGRVTSRHRGGGHKQRYRIIDFRRDKDGVPAKVATIEYDPNRNARIALLNYVDGEKRYILAPVGVKPGRHARVGPERRHPARQRPAAAQHPRRYRRPRHRDASRRRRQAGPVGRRLGPAHVQGERDGPPASALGEMRMVSLDCRATVGQVGNTEAELIKLGKAGRNRWKGVRPQTRGVAMNPVDHPLGGGEGKSSGGRVPVSPWGKPEARTRKKKNASNKYIVRRRTKKGRR
jgi:large subunit ribosomal protein L2